MSWWKKFKSLKPRYRFLITILSVFIVFWIIPGILTKGRWMLYVDRPYKGQIIDMETQQAIEGMVVFAKYYIKSPSPGGSVTRYVFAREVMTDKDGTFKLPIFFRIGVSPLDYFEEEPSLTIFKPGYHWATPYWDPLGVCKHAKIDKPIKSHAFVTIEVKRLKSMEERKKNMEHFLYPAGNYYKNKYMLFQLYNQERVNIGLDPFPELG